jgi:6-phosphogluconate dehydrogenase
MQLGVIGLGRMGANICRRLLRAGHDCVVHDTHPDAVSGLADEGATGAASLADFVRRLTPPRNVWLMVPAAAVEPILTELATLLEPGDVVIDGGNSNHRDDIRRAGQLGAAGIHHVDVGTSGGVWGLEQGFCLMIGGESAVVQRLDPIFSALAPGIAAAPRTPGRAGAGASAEQGYLHCGASGAGHFVKMVHNGIEYGIMAAYAEGLNILRHAGSGSLVQKADAETAPLEDPAAYQYDLNLGEVAEVWRRGSVIRSWLLDLTAQALLRDADLAAFQGRVSDSGEGRWTLKAAIDTGVPVPVLSAALFARFSSRGEGGFADKLLSAMRSEFGGHAEAPAQEQEQEGPQ